MADLASALRQAVGDRPVCRISLPRGWPSGQIDFRGPLDYLGKEGGGGVGSGPGIAVGAALALQETDRLPLAVIGDGDFLMGNSALWTAAHHRLPLLVVVANNRTYHNDEVHQEQVARRRDRPVENRSVGQHLRDPDPDLAAMASSMGLHGYGPVRTPAELQASLAKAIADVEAGGAAVVDVRVLPGNGEARPAQCRAGFTIIRRLPRLSARPPSAVPGRGPAPGRRRSPPAAACGAAARPSPG
jgi:thiamine pyrophosphate-dependent acetolactate synthase large subunit-like protein